MDNITTFLQNNKEYVDILMNFLKDFGPRLIGAILVILIGFKVVNIINQLIIRALQKAKIDPMLESFIKSIISVLLKIIVIVSAAGVLGVETSAFVAMLAAAGLAVGMALSGTLQNFAGGVIIVMFKPYRIGDYISIGDVEGTVKEIHIFNTILTTIDKKTVIVPNAEISNGTMTNYSAEPIRRLDLDIGISYSDDIDLAKSTLWEIINKEERIIEKENSTVAVVELGDNAVIVTCRTFVQKSEYWNLKFDMLEAIKKTFDEKGLNFPFPQREVHVKKEGGGLFG